MSNIKDFYATPSGSGIQWIVVSSDTTAEANKGYIINNTGASRTLTLPATPSVGDVVGYKDLAGKFSDFPLTVARNGKKIESLTEDMTVDTVNAYGELVYSGTTNGWVLTGASPALPVVTKPFFHAQDQKAYNVDGGTSIADAWTKRTLNTVVYNDITGASLVGDSVSLPAGLYYVEGKAIMNRQTATTTSVIMGIFKDGVKSIQGTSECPPAYDWTPREVSGVITLSVSGTIDLRYYSGTGEATSGLGTSNNAGSITDTSIPSIYADLKIWRLDANKQIVAGPQFSAGDIGKSLVVSGEDSQSYQHLRGRKNYIINGNFDIWQRATSQTSSGYGSDDRWVNANIGSAKTHTRQLFTLGQTDVPGNPKYYSRTVVTSVGGASNYVHKIQKIESVLSLAGKKATLSFWAKADAPKNIAAELYQSFGTGGSPSSPVSGIGAQLVALTTAWAKYSITVDIPSISGKTLGTDNNDAISFNWWFDAGSSWNTRTASLGQQSGTFDIAQVQLEEGEIATEFERRTWSEELTLCQRYFVRWSSFSAGIVATGHSYSTVNSAFTLVCPVPMRAFGILSTGNLHVNSANGPFIACSGASLSQPSTCNTIQVDTTVATGLTAGSATLLFVGAGSGGWLNVDAEL